MKIAVLFPGQGSQFLGMGRDFIAQDRASRELMAMAEDVCQMSLGRLINDGPLEDLTRNARLQPAITVTNLICWQNLRQRFDEKKISCFAGHSLGEYSALCAAGAVSAEDTLRLVAKRGALMERAGEEHPGGMRAVIGLAMEQLAQIIERYDGPGVVAAANHNTAEQIVISGSIEGLDGVTAIAEEKGAKVVALNVSVANHSPLVAAAVPEFSRFLQTITFAAPSTPVYFNVSAQRDADPVTIKQMMGQQIVSRVRWYELIGAMLADGVDTFIEVGPKTVLKGMMRKIKPQGVDITTLQFDSPTALAACLEKLAPVE
ncbi:MAG: ACP S-malonyltransferase [Desulfopila sp.]